MVNKQDITNGIANYIHEYVLPGITDDFSKRVMSGFAYLITLKPNTLDNILEKYPIFDMFCENGMYDLDVMEKVIKSNIAEFGDITLNVMGAKYIFDANDVTNLMHMIK